MEGREQVAGTMAEQLAGPMRGSTHELTVTTVRLLRPDVAVLDGDVVVSLPSGHGGRSHTTWILVRELDRWLIGEMRGYYRTDNLPTGRSEGGDDAAV